MALLSNAAVKNHLANLIDTDLLFKLYNMMQCVTIGKKTVEWTVVVTNTSSHPKSPIANV